MRDTLCAMLRDYIEEGEGEKSVFFSTHNIADMENVTDYAIIMELGLMILRFFINVYVNLLGCYLGVGLAMAAGITYGASPGTIQNAWA